jgi:hypothetical protein
MEKLEAAAPITSIQIHAFILAQRQFPAVTLPSQSARGANIVVCCGVSWFLIIVAEQEIPSRPAR